MEPAASSKLKRRSWPLSCRQSWRGGKCFEAEDASHIPEFYIAKPHDLCSPHRVNLMMIMRTIQKLGQNPHTMTINTPYSTIEKRCCTFQSPWRGPPAGLMAECGLYKASEDSATCYSCGITLRALTTATCVWTHHQHFAPSCLHQQRAKRCNPHRLEGGQRRYVRHLSSDDAPECGLQFSML